MRSQLEQRTETEEIAFLASIQSPYMKDFRFMPNKKVDAHEILGSALGLKDTAVVKEKPDDIQNTDDPLCQHLLSSLTRSQMLRQSLSLNHRLYPTSWLSFIVSTVSLSLSHWYPESGVVLDCINSSPLQPFLTLQSPSKNFKSADTDNWLMDIVCVGETKQNVENLVVQKIARYLGSNVKAEDECLTVLQWWKANECFYPRISRLAKKYLACQASSISSERVFSLASTLVSKKRVRLSTSNVGLIFFKKRAWKHTG